MIVDGRVRFTAAGRALRHWNFRLFFLGQLISVTGTWMQTLAQGWLLGTIVGWDQAVVYIGILGAVQFLPVLLLGLFGGIIVDMFPKRQTVIATQILFGLLALVLGLLDWFNVVQVWHIFVLAVLLGFLTAVDMPARQSFVVEMVGPEDVANAVALNSAVFNAARIVGPSVAGLLIAILGTAPCFIINGLSYVAVVAGLLAMRDSELIPVRRLAMPKNAGEIRDSLAEGLSYVRHTPLVLLAIAVIGLVSTFGMNFNVVLPVLAADVLKAGPDGYGWLSASMGAGAMTAALIVASFERPRIRVLIGGGLLLGIGEVILGSTTSYPLAMVLVFVCGLAMISCSASANSLIQVTVPGTLRGRVMSVYTTVFSGSTPIGNTFTGGVGGLWSTSAALLIEGAITLVTAAVGAVAAIRGHVQVGGGSPGGGGRRTEWQPEREIEPDLAPAPELTPVPAPEHAPGPELTPAPGRYRAAP